MNSFLKGLLKKDCNDSDAPRRKNEKKQKMTINCGTGLLLGHREQGAACALCRRVLCAPILIQELFFYRELTDNILKTFQYDG